MPDPPADPAIRRRRVDSRPDDLDCAAPPAPLRPRLHPLPRVRVVIHPKVRGFICTTAHPVGCDRNVQEQIRHVQAQGVRSDGPKRVLVIGSSTGYGLAARITAAFGYGAATLGVFFEKPGTEKKPGNPGWYNSAAFDRHAKAAGLWSRSINGDAFSNEVREKAIELAREMGGPIDLVVYSLASPVRRLPDSGELKRSSLKPIGKPYEATAVDTNRDQIIHATVEPATEQEIADTVTVMGGKDWELWIDALSKAGVLAPDAKTVAFSYIGTEITLADLLARRAGQGQGRPGPRRARDRRRAQARRRPGQRRRAQVGGDPGQRRDPGDAAVHRHRVPDHEGQGPA